MRKILQKTFLSVKAKGINNPGKNRPDTYFWQTLSYILKNKVLGIFGISSVLLKLNYLKMHCEVSAA